MRRSDLKQSEYGAFYAGYIAKLPDEDLIQLLEQGLESTTIFFESLAPEKLEYAYAEGKWTPKEILLHMIDTERIMAYRALRFARGDENSLPGFEEDLYVANSNASERKLDDLVEEYRLVRKSSISLFKNLPQKNLKLGGVASGNFMSAAAAGFVIAGHELHHVEIIRKRYL